MAWQRVRSLRHRISFPLGLLLFAVTGIASGQGAAYSSDENVSRRGAVTEYGDSRSNAPEVAEEARTARESDRAPLRKKREGSTVQLIVGGTSTDGKAKIAKIPVIQ